MHPCHAKKITLLPDQTEKLPIQAQKLLDQKTWGALVHLPPGYKLGPSNVQYDPGLGLVCLDIRVGRVVEDVASTALVRAPFG